jgi:hypothetical protein
MISRDELRAVLKSMRDMFVENRDELKLKADKDDLERLLSGVLAQTMERVEANNSSMTTNLPGAIEAAVSRALDEKMPDMVRAELEAIEAYRDEQRESRLAVFFKWVGYGTGILIAITAAASAYLTFFGEESPEAYELKRAVDRVQEL